MKNNYDNKYKANYRNQQEEIEYLSNKYENLSKHILTK